MGPKYEPKLFGMKKYWKYLKNRAPSLNPENINSYKFQGNIN